MTTPPSHPVSAPPAAGVEPRCLGFWQGTAIVSGNMIGAGIFLLPGLVARYTQATAPFLLLWLIGGLWALLGALSLAELGAMMPRAGGEYIYIREAYGRPWAFMSGWLALLVTFPGSIALMTFLTMKYQGPTLFGAWLSGTCLTAGSLNITWAHVAAILLILVLTWINHRSTALSSWFQFSMTAVAILVLVVICAGIFGMFSREAAGTGTAHSDGLPAVKIMLLGFLPVYFAYAGWNAVTYLGGDMRKPSRNLPLSLLGGTLLVTAVYMLTCFAYTRVVPVAAMTSKINLGATAARAVLGEYAPLVVDTLIFVAVAGSVNATILAGSRIYLAMARDNLFIGAAARLHSRHRTPAWSLWIQGIWACLLVFVGTLEQILDYTVTMMLLLSIMTVGAVFLLRWKRREWPRPYRAWAYPVTPLLYIAICLIVLWGAFQKESPWSQLIGIGLGVVGLAVYFVRRGWSRAGAIEKRSDHG